MQLNVSGQPDMNMVLQARRIQDQQRATVQQMQQQAQHQQIQQGSQGLQQLPQGVGGVQGSPTGMRPAANGINQQNFMANAQAIMASFNGAGSPAMATPPRNGLNMPSVSAGSPRATMAQAQMTPQMASSLKELENQLRAKNPSLTAEQARLSAFQNLQTIMAMQRQAAVSAASGATPQQPMMNGLMGTSPHQYAQLLRAQQQAQANGVQQGAQHQRQSSAGGTSVGK
jgi:chromatin modification-related protein VID21